MYAVRSKGKWDCCGWGLWISLFRLKRHGVHHSKKKGEKLVRTLLTGAPGQTVDTLSDARVPRPQRRQLGPRTKSRRDQNQGRIGSRRIATHPEICRCGSSGIMLGAYGTYARPKRTTNTNLVMEVFWKHNVLLKNCFRTRWHFVLRVKFVSWLELLVLRPTLKVSRSQSYVKSSE